MRYRGGMSALPQPLPQPLPLRRWPWKKLAAVAVFVLVTGGPTVIAAPDDSASRFWFLQQQAPPQQAPGAVIKRQRPHFVREPQTVREPQAREPARRRVYHPPPAGAPPVPPGSGSPAVLPEAVPASGTPPVLPAEIPAPAAAPDAAPAAPVIATPALPAPALPAPALPAPAPPALAATPAAPALPVVALPVVALPSEKLPEISFFISVLGDNIGQLLAQGLQESFADKPQVLVRRKARESTGLVRDDYYDWLKIAREMTGGQDRERIDMAVIMIGSNDRQALREGNASVDVRSDRWKEIYGQRVEDLAALFRDRKIPLVWVGLPVMRNERLSSDILFFNQIYRERATKAGAVYVDTWDAFVDDKGQYDPYGPDVNGQNVKLRTGDGVHFTKAGALKLAHFAEGDIRRALAGAKAPAEIAAVPVPGAAATDPAPAPTVPAAAGKPAASEAPLDMTALLNAQIKRDAQSDPAVSIQAALPLPDAPADLSFPLRAAAGPVVSLTAPPLAVGGLLATRGKRSPSPLGGEAQAMLDRVLADGRPADTKPGRADDFSWPRR